MVLIWLFLSMLSGSAVAQSAPTRLFEPVIDSKRGLLWGAEVEVRWSGLEDGADVVVFPSCAQQMNVSSGHVLQEFEIATRNAPELPRVLGLLFGSDAQRSRSKPVIVLTDFSSGRSTYSSFFVHRYPGLDRPGILLDCSAAARRYWVPSLAHEWVHAFSQGLDLPSWFEETLAQLIEARAGGLRPKRSLESVYFDTSLGSSAGRFPPLWDDRRPLRGQEAYSLSYLFGEYLVSRFGGFELLRAMIAGEARDADCKRDGSRWSELACLGRRHLERTDARLSSIVTPEGLLRYFAVALVLNSTRVSLYSAPGWGGTRIDYLSPLTQDETLAPGQFRVAPAPSTSDPCALAQRQSASASGLEIYFFRYSTQAFEIVDCRSTEKAAPHPARSEMLFKAMLLINPSSASVTIRP